MVSDTTTSQGSSQENVTMPTCMAQIRALRYEQTPIIIIISIIIIIIIIIQG
jgi:t-SNARE complex subunit (syntaxin)